MFTSMESCSATRNWDSRMLNFESHKIPESVRTDSISSSLDEASLSLYTTTVLQKPLVLFSPNSKTSVVQDSLNCAFSSSFQLTVDASIESSNTSIPNSSEKTPLFDILDPSDTDRVSDIVTDAPNPWLSPTIADEVGSHSIARNETRHSSLSALPFKSETFAPSPALTVNTISDDDEEVIIVDHIQTSFSPENKTSDEAPTSTFRDSLFTPPPSEGGTLSSSPPPLNHAKKSRIYSSPQRRRKTVVSHISIPPLSRPKSEYVNMSNLVVSRLTTKRPQRMSQERLEQDAARKNNERERLDWSGEHGDEEGEARGKKRKRKPKDQEGWSPVSEPSKRVRNDEESVIFVNRMSKVNHQAQAKEEPPPPETTFIDLTLDDDDEKPLQLLSEPPQSVPQATEMPSPDRQPTICEEIRIRLGVVHAVSYRTLLFNTRLLRGTKRGVADLDKHSNVDPLLPFRRRRALLDNNLEAPNSQEDEFSLGHPVVTDFCRNAVDEDYDYDSGEEVAELLDSFSDPVTTSPSHSPRTRPPSSQAKESMPPPPKIDLAAKFRKRKTTTARRTSSTKKVAPPAQPISPTVSRSPASSLKNNGLVQNEVMGGVERSPHTPLVPSAKALGKRKAIDLPMQPLFPSSHPPMTTSENAPPSTDAENNFDIYINFGPPSPLRYMTLASDNPSYLGAGGGYGYPDPYSNLTLSAPVPNVDSHQHHANPPLSSVEPPASLLYHSEDYTTGTRNDFDCFTASVLGDGDPPPSEPPTLFPSWPDAGFSYDGGTVNPSLLGGETFGMSEHPAPDFPEVGNEVGSGFWDTEKEKEKESHHSAITKLSPSRSHSASPRTLSSKVETSPSVHLCKEGSDTIFVRRRQPTTNTSNHDKHSRRRRSKRVIPDMVPLSALCLSSESESADGDDESARSVIVSKARTKRPTPVNHSQSKSKSRPIVARKTALPLPASLNMAGPKVMVGGQLWPMQDEATYCHQCRNKTMVLKFECPLCSKIYCVRCLTTRYLDEPRALQMKKVGCPACLEYCNCTKCCQRRGVEYISTKDAMAGGIASRARLSAPGKFKLSSTSLSSSLHPSPTPDTLPPRCRTSSPVFSSTHLTPAEGLYWGTVYGADGSKIGGSFTYAKEDVVKETSPVVSTNSVSEADPTDVQPRKKKRIYVGMIHPSWQFDKAVKMSVVDPIPPPKRVHASRRPRKYIGNKAFLFYKSERMARELADLSPLSSLEEDWDEEDGGTKKAKADKEEGDMTDIVQTEYSQQELNGSVFSKESLTDNDIMRAIGLGLHACGIQLAGSTFKKILP